MKNRFENFTVYISKISRCVRKIKNIAMEEYNLRSHHVSVLYYLYLDDSLAAKDLCDKCEEDKGTISRSISYLEDNGFITCSTNNKKRYNAHFKLTEKGKTVGKALTDKVNAVLDEVSICLTEEERVNLYEYLSRLSSCLEELTDLKK